MRNGKTKKDLNDDAIFRQDANFRNDIKAFHSACRKQIAWLRKKGFHEVINCEFHTVNFKTRRWNGNCLCVIPMHDGWHCFAIIGNELDSGTEAVSKYHPNLAIHKSKERMQKKINRIYRNF